MDNIAAFLKINCYSQQSVPYLKYFLSYDESMREFTITGFVYVKDAGGQMVEDFRLLFHAKTLKELNSYLGSQIRKWEKMP